MYFFTLLLCLSAWLFGLSVTALPAKSSSPDKPTEVATATLEQATANGLYVGVEDTAEDVNVYTIPGTERDSFAEEWVKHDGQKWAQEVSCHLTYNETRYYGTYGQYFLASQVTRVSVSIPGFYAFEAMDDSELEKLPKCHSYVGLFNSNGHEDGAADDEFKKANLGECIKIKKTYAGKTNGIFWSDGESKKELANRIEADDRGHHSTGALQVTRCMAFQDNECKNRLEKHWRIPPKEEDFFKTGSEAPEIPKGTKSVICF